MQNKLSSGGKPSVLLIADLDDLSFSLSNTLIEKSCKVFILSRNNKSWKKAFENILKKSEIEFLNEKELFNLEKLDYAIFHFNLFKSLNKGPQASQKEIGKSINYLLNKLKPFRTKFITLIPAICGKLDGEGFGFGKTIYFSETFGRHQIFVKNNFFLSALESISLNKKVVLPKKEILIKPALSDNVADQIIKILFSFSFSTETTISGREISSSEFIETLNDTGVDVGIKTKNFKYYKNLVIGEEIVLGNSSNQSVEFSKTIKEQPTNKPRGLKIKKYFLKAAFLILGIILIPFLALLLSVVGMATSFYLIEKGDFTNATKTLVVTHSTAEISEEGFKAISFLPGIGPTAKDVVAIAEIIKRGASLSRRGTGLLKDLNYILTNFLANRPYDISEYSQRITPETEYLYEESGFILGEIYSSKPLNKLLFQWLDKNSILEKREQLLEFSNITKNLPDILGEGSEKKYLILFQNNMELRPTGGFIGSFAIAQVEGGGLQNLNIWDVFSADGQLKGHIEPPSPIKKYLNEANWFLRDSNWDPDFTVSATRAEWFLDKEIDQSVDGTIAIDLELVKNIIEIVGPINLKDFETVIDKNNFYEITQSEVEKDFFPGSQKKSNFLTAITKALTESVKDLPKQKGVEIGKVIFSGFDKRHIQLFLHDRESAGALKKLGWDGGLPEIGFCGLNCYSDLIGVVEANVGVNKANLFIERSLEVKVNLEDNKIGRELTLNLKNNAKPETGQKGLYKAFVRVIAPQQAIFEKVFVKNEDTVFYEMPELLFARNHQEAGVLVNVLPGETTTLKFFWEEQSKTDLGTRGEYKLIIRKQAGTVNDPIRIGVSLTGGADFEYNTFLARDFVSRISW